MVTAYIGLGANLGDCRKSLLEAWSMIGRIEGVTLLALSSPYMTEPVGMASENWFINGAGSLETDLDPAGLLAELLAVEKRLGRKRTADSDLPADRPVDLDLLYWGDRISSGPEVILPHPEIANRLFVLQPLAEIAPEVKHPVNRQTTLQMLENLLESAGCIEKVIKTSWSAQDAEVAM